LKHSRALSSKLPGWGCGCRPLCRRWATSAGSANREPAVCLGPPAQPAGAPDYTGKVGRDLTTAEGYQAATINLLGTVRQALGSLDRVTRVVKLFGMVNSTEDFTEQPQVINGASDLLQEVFGRAAVHARSAVGMPQLPRNSCVEVEAVIELDGSASLA
jgi:enamine deaminase RidA (YjgF/YER057c/UK114 family)